MNRIKTFSLFLFCLLIAVVALAHAQEGIIKEIVVFGNERVDETIILNEITSKVGASFSQERIREDTKAIYRLGYFRDVQVDVSETKEGVALTFVVIEKPYVADIIISGNVKLSREDIEEVIGVKRDSVLDMNTVTSSTEEIKKLYAEKRYFGSEVDYWVDLEEGNRAIVYFDIVEGVKGYLTKIRFKGNKAFGARKLRSVMQTKEKGWFWWLIKSGRLETDVLGVDVTRIRSLYHDHGYVMVIVSEPEITLSENKKSLQVTISIEEGDQYRLGSLDVTGDILTTKEELLKGLKGKVGKVYRSSVTQKDLLWLTDNYADEGYAYVDVSPLTMLDHEQKLVHLTYKIEKGVKANINRIEIAGNTKTRDKVVRRELKIAEGDLYNATRLRKSRQRVMRTGYFKEVDFATSPTEKKELIDLGIKVDEAEMGKLEFGAGYGTLTGVVGSVGLSHGNLFGLGYKAYIYTEAGEKVLDFKVGFTDPRFLDTPVSLGFDVFKETFEYSTYDADVIGGDIKIGREITDTISAALVYLWERVSIYNIDYDASRYIWSQRGTTITSKLTFTLSRNTIDNPYTPQRGSNIWASGFIAGPGGDNYFYGTRVGASWFHPLVADLVLNLRGNIGIVRGYNGKEVPLHEKFYVGGKTLRGFEYGTAGPVDEVDEPIGALNMVTFTTELLYPVSKALGLRAAVFYDIGKGWGGEEPWDNTFDRFLPVQHAAGVGIRWYSPFGPIRIDWGYNLNPIHGQKPNVWDFSMGTTF